ncbi:non-hydrolyzing UDP-N-acetylglucosamine 2-epimerase [Sphingobacterium faecale]|uniref:UDP-N-acetylglucosamine 2-epimerase (Non-hydrolyzing) n=1 Tax=Sphingobacterium faecale TaxID=2803775 RepID=A0ABS1R8N5_9SPHI|nr:UDP-N-acetylglucosamine 2-epimerase (non-hydrolyzing) [Sphingobacterium faecale]MBL1410347.1 UDP-N-acetylglucosamine 2-epimerase (non-hydrolyzing) [Sphingobacterium faecale]
MKKIIAIVGARPQFIKHFPFEKACEDKIDLITIHTGQHYDENMSKVFFDQLGMSRPRYVLNNGGGNHGEQTAKMIIEIERILLDENPEALVVYGDTNSTLAGALVAAKLHIPVYHIEAGLRSFNKKMPEEVNRVLTDHISTKLFVTSEVAIDNLEDEGITEGVVLVGDIMKDVVNMVIQDGHIGKAKYDFSYFYTTIHRPYNTDDPKRLMAIFERLNTLCYKVVIALHPRTKKLSLDYGINIEQYTNLVVIEPQSYFDNLSLLYHSSGLITDSGGMQKEAYWLNKKCVTIRTETEWLETAELNGNILMFDNLDSLEMELLKTPIEWDNNLYGQGDTAQRIVKTIIAK